MGGCASARRGCVVFPFPSKRKVNVDDKKKNDNGEGGRRRRKSRRRIIKRRVSSRKLETADPSRLTDRAFSNPVFQGSMDGTWCDATSVLESEWDDEFYSVYEDGSSVIDSYENGSSIGVQSPRDLSARDPRDNAALTPDNVPTDGSVAMNLPPKHPNSSSKLNDTQEEVSSVSVVGDGRGIADNHCGVLHNNCLPCLQSTVPTVEKKKSIASDTASSKKKSMLRLSFKWREEHTPTLFAPKGLSQRPLAGSTFPYCPADKKIPGCWSPIEPNTFKVRGRNYFRGRTTLRSI
ncbi:hypothetical protein LINGRAHAP2_LOCUS6815 [Linum grandiflorum]